MKGYVILRPEVECENLWDIEASFVTTAGSCPVDLWWLHHRSVRRRCVLWFGREHQKPPYFLKADRIHHPSHFACRARKEVKAATIWIANKVDREGREINLNESEPMFRKLVEFASWVNRIAQSPFQQLLEKSKMKFKSGHIRYSSPKMQAAKSKRWNAPGKLSYSMVSCISRSESTI